MFAEYRAIVDGKSNCMYASNYLAGEHNLNEHCTHAPYLKAIYINVESI